MRFKDFFKESYSYQRVGETDRDVTYEFTSGSHVYNVLFENSGQYGWEMMFGLKTDDGMDTKILTNSPQEVTKVLNTIFEDILKDFIQLSLSYENSIDIILAPQRLDNEAPNMDPFNTKRGRVYVKKIKDSLKHNQDLNVEFVHSPFAPPSIIMKISKKENHEI